MSQNIGTLISASIRPNDSLDPIATAYSVEIKGGLHTKTSISDRNSIIFERREWGMMCYVTNDDKTYQLNYNYSSTDIMDNSNWVEFNGSGGSGTEWIDSVISVNYIQPGSPINGDRYLVGLKPGDVLTGGIWGAYSPGYIAEWNSVLTLWDLTIPTDGMSVRVDIEDNCIYRYEGIFPSGEWAKEKLGQVRSISVTTIDGFSYSCTSDPIFESYFEDMIFLTKFDSQNLGNTASLDINGLGTVLIKKPSQSGISNLNPYDIQPNNVYSLVYDGTYFQLNRPYVNEDLFNVKYYVEPNDYIVVPQYYQYWVYSDLEIAGDLVNYGHVIIANGSLIMSGGTFSNYGSLVFVNLAGASYNDSDTIQFTQSNTIYGASVSAIVRDGSLTASKLDTGFNGGATAGYVLSVDNVGDFSWVQPIASTMSGGTGSVVYQSHLTPLATAINANFQSTGITLSFTPNGYSSVSVYVNGNFQYLGDGVGTVTASGVDCYFSSDGGFTAKSISALSSGDVLYWNGYFLNSGFKLDVTDKIDIIYES